MRFVTIEIGCDWDRCEVRAPEGSDELTERTIAVDRRAPRKVQLCAVHNKELSELLDPLLQRGESTVAAPVKRSTTPSGNGDTVHHTVEIKCRVPGCGGKAKGNVGLAQHLKKKHGMTIAEHDLLQE